MEMMAATATAHGSDDGGVDDNDNNGVIAMVINLDLHTVGVRRYVARLNLMGGHGRVPLLPGGRWLRLRRRLWGGG